jgi:murein DD-endopeptidase MepM/ murein hydrolase activator NlpD
MDNELNLKIISILLFFAFIIISCHTTINSDKDESAICSSQETSEYVIPYPVGTTYTCIQGYVGRTYHKGVFKYGVDFLMPIGSIVTCARGGRVIFIEESFSDEDYGIEKANVVVVLHADSTYGRYVHLTKNGALVEIGQTVAQGDTIGLSGSSGYSPKPHLHFDVTEDCPQSNCQTIPICFKNTKPHPYGLVTGESYIAEPY